VFKVWLRHDLFEADGGRPFVDGSPVRVVRPSGQA
jgi:hypothetical protein